MKKVSFTSKIEVRLFFFQAIFSVSPLSLVKDIIMRSGESIVSEHLLSITLAHIVDLVLNLNRERAIQRF